MKYDDEVESWHIDTLLANFKRRAASFLRGRKYEGAYERSKLGRLNLTENVSHFRRRTIMERKKKKQEK